VIPAACYLASVAGLWAAAHGAVVVGDTTRGAYHLDYLTGRAEFDLNTVPALGITLQDGRHGFSGGYAPDLTFRSLLHPEDRKLLTLHRAYLGYAYGGPGYTISLNQSASVGNQTYWALRTTPIDPNIKIDPTVPRIDLLPAAATLRVFNESTAASLDYRWSARWNSQFSANYAISGGLDHISRLVLPQQRIGTGGVAAGYLATKADNVGAGITASNIHTSLGTEYWTLALQGSWNHRFAADVSGSLSVGAMGARTPVATGPADYTVNLLGTASGNVGLYKGRRTSLGLGFGGGLTSGVGTYNGLLQQRVQGSAGLTAVVGPLGAAANVDASQTLPPDDPNATRIIGAGGGLNYTPAPFISFYADYRSAWQHANIPMNATGPQAQLINIPYTWFLSFGVSLHAPAYRF
jgi:hypothetical protein